MPTLLRRNYFITNLKTSHSTRVSLKFIINTQFFNIRACFCWPQMARGIVSCGFGGQDCKLLDFQIKLCETNHCKPSKSCWFFPFLFLQMFTALKQGGVGAGVRMVQPSMVAYDRHPLSELHWCLLDRRGGPRRVLPHHNPFASISATLSGPLGECSATKAATSDLSVCLAAKGFVVAFLFLNAYFPKQTH